MRALPICLALILLAPAGCRAGFAPTPGQTGDGATPDTRAQDGGGSTPDGQPPPPDGPGAADLPGTPTPYIANKDSAESCASPLTVDLSSLPVQIVVNTTGAITDHSANVCGETPDLVLKLVNAAPPVQWTCSGSTALIKLWAMQGSACPGSAGSTTSSQCGSGNQSTLPEGTYLVICWDPANGPATLTLGI